MAELTPKSNSRGCPKSQRQLIIEKWAVLTIQHIVTFTDAVRLKNAGQVLSTETSVQVGLTHRNFSEGDLTSGNNYPFVKPGSASVE